MSLLNNLSNTICKNNSNFVLIGAPGVGKTRIINSICNQDFENNNEKFSKNEIKIGHVENLTFIEIPSLNIQNDVLESLDSQKNIIENINIKGICIIVKYDNRYDEILKNIRQVYTIFKNFRENIIVILSFSDEITEETEKESLNKIIFKKFGIKNIQYSSLKSSKLDLTKFFVNFDKNVVAITSKNNGIYVSEFNNQIENSVVPIDYELLSSYKQEFKNYFNNCINNFNRQNFDLYSERRNESLDELTISITHYKNNSIISFTRELRKKFDLNQKDLKLQILLFEKDIDQIMKILTEKRFKKVTIEENKNEQQITNYNQNSGVGFWRKILNFFKYIFCCC